MACLRLVCSETGRWYSTNLDGGELVIRAPMMPALASGTR